MQTLLLILFVSGLFPWWKALETNALRPGRTTSLAHALFWGLGAWAIWGLALLAYDRWPADSIQAISYLALSLTGCAGVAVLGARRPGVRAWNAVVGALLAVLLLPLARRFVMGGTFLPDQALLLCLGGTLSVSVLNYLPTRLWFAALLVGTACGSRLIQLTAIPQTEFSATLPWEWFELAAAPWAAYIGVSLRSISTSEFDDLWLGYRDRYGLVWGQRLREQFNSSAKHAGWQVVLRWGGLRLRPGSHAPDAARQEEMVRALQALMKKFME